VFNDLAEMRCDLPQGDPLSRPLPAAQPADWLTAQATPA
jgi:EAL domain-containing protein (putative c-di-GMP-specific phosphodiesterase class I)